MKKYLIIISMIFIIINLSALEIIDSSLKRRPLWLNENPIGKKFNYYSGLSSSQNSLDEAKTLAISDVLSEIIMQNEITVEGNISTFEAETEKELISKITKEIKLKGSSTSIKGLEKEEEYWEIVQTTSGLLYRYWILMKIPKNKISFEKNLLLDSELSYGLKPILKSIVVPGWGQIHKKETKK